MTTNTTANITANITTNITEVVVQHTPILNSQVQSYLIDLTNKVEFNHIGADTAWISTNLYLILLMQIGFNFLEAGSSRHKNFVYTLLKNTMNACVVTLIFWLVGFGFAHGESVGSGIGKTYFASDLFHEYENYNKFMINWAFAVTSFAIAAGCVQERLSIWINMFHAFFYAGFVYPLAVHWAWNPKGWLSEMGYIDFAGCGVIHMVGGASGIGALLIVGARKNRYTPGREDDFKLSNVPMIGLATVLLWFCWYGFNCGSLEAVVKTSETDYTTLIGLVGLNTTISASAGGLITFGIQYLINRNKEEEYSLCALCNGILVGLVSVGACVNNTHPWCALLIGIVSGPIYLAYAWLTKKLKLDDPVDAIPIHFGAGSWGVVAAGFFDLDKGILFGDNGKQLGIQLLGVVLFTAWSLIFTLLVFLLLKACNQHRVSEEVEEQGIDIALCGGLANYFDEVSASEYAKNLVKKKVDYNKVIVNTIPEERVDTEKNINDDKDIDNKDN